MLGPCRLPYSLIDNNNNKLDNGYILSPRDLCGLDYLPFLIKSGVTSFKIEGRMKTPEYVATVTRIYRKYMDLAISDEQYIVDEKDKKDLLQVFNRGLSSYGHLSDEPNKNLIYKNKPSNMGLPLGIVEKYDKNKGYITLNLKEELQIGDTISLEHESGTYTVSELMQNKHNINIGKINQKVTIGRMKGNISLKDNIYKISSKELNTFALSSINTENRKIHLNAEITIMKNKPLSILVTTANDIDLYKNLKIEYTINEFPVDAQKRPLSEETVIEKISKTGNTPFEFNKITVNIDNNVFIPKLSLLNELRRGALEEVEKYVETKIKRISNTQTSTLIKENIEIRNNKFPKISVLLNILNLDYDYSKLENIDNLYIPLKYFINKKYSNALEILSSKFNTYIYLPTIIKTNFSNFIFNNIEIAIKKYKIKGFVLSNISNFVFIEKLSENTLSNFDLIANYTFNIFNNETINRLKEMNIKKYTISPELDKSAILSLKSNISSELIVYGNVPLMTTNYCLLGKTNKCYPNCDMKCKNDTSYYLKDRINMNFEIIPDNLQTITTIYNSKILSISPNDFCIDFARIDILHEDINKINTIINTVKSNKRFEGKDFTNGNLNRII